MNKLFSKGIFIRKRVTMTDDRILKSTYHWESDLKDLQSIKNGMCLESKPFRICHNLNSLEFQLRMYPKGISKDGGGIFLYIWYRHGFKDRLNAKCSFDLSCDGVSFACAEQTQFHLITHAYYYQGFRLRSASTSPPLCNLPKQSPGENSKIKCTCIIRMPLSTFNYKPLPPAPLIEDTIIGQSLLKCVLDDKLPNKFADVTLISNDGTRFRCHKAILAVRAPVFFEPLFNCNMAERTNEEIRLPSVNSPALTEVLRFIYKNEIIPENIKPLAKLILNVAEMFQLEILKQYCAASLYEDLTSLNAVEMIKLGHLFSLKDLKEKSVCIAAENYDTIQCSQEWLEFLVENPSIASKVVSHINEKINVYTSVSHDRHTAR